MNTRTIPITKQLAILGVASLALTCAIAAASEKPDTPRAPSTWGMLGTHSACVIFREYQKTKVGFFVVIVTTKTHSELEVIETTDGYTMDRAKYIEDDATMSELQHRAIKEGLRYVKVSDKYTPEELETARALCKQDVVTE